MKASTMMAKKSAGDRSATAQLGDRRAPAAPAAGCAMVPATNEPIAAVASAWAARPALGHLVALDGGDDRRALAGGVEQDRRRRPAVHAAVVDAGEHDAARWSTSRPQVSGRSSAIVMAGPMPGSTPIAVPSRTPMKAYSRFIGVSAVPKPLDQVVERVHQRIPFRMPTGRLMPRPRANRYQEPTRQDERDDRVADVVPAAEGEGRSRRRGSRRRSASRARSMSRALATNAADQHGDGAPVAAAGEVDVLAALRLAAAAAEDVDGEEDRRRRRAGCRRRSGPRRGRPGPRAMPALRQEQRLRR